MPLNIDEFLDPAEQLSIAEDTLRGRVSDYLRLSLLDPALNGGPERLTAMEAEIASIKKRVNALRRRLPAPPTPVAPADVPVEE